MRLFPLHEQQPRTMCQACYEEGSGGCTELELHVCVGISNPNRKRYAGNVAYSQGMFHARIDKPKEGGTKERHGHKQCSNDAKQETQIVRREDDVEDEEKDVHRRKPKDCFHLSTFLNVLKSQP